MNCRKCNQPVSLHVNGDGWNEYVCICGFGAKWKPIKVEPPEKIREILKKAGKIIVLPSDFGDKKGDK